MDLFKYSRILSLCLLVLKTCTVRSQHIGRLYPGFEASQQEWINSDGRFLLSNNSVFCFGFYASLAPQFFLLVVTHISSEKAVWTANRGLLISGSDKFVFAKNGDVHLQRGNGVAWSSNTTGQKVTSMELQDTGNLVLLGDSGVVLWQSFSHPTNTLLPGQEFREGMKLKSIPNSNNLSVYLEFKSGDLVLSAGYQTPQIYWSLANEGRKTNNTVNGKVHSASLLANAWNFYDQDKMLLWQFLFSKSADQNAIWALFLGHDGVITFVDLEKTNTTPAAIKVPESVCDTPEPCGPYYACDSDFVCYCPVSLESQFNCKPPVASTCNSSKNTTELLYVGENFAYFAVGFATPFSQYDLDACKEACLDNCGCSMLYFEDSTQNCYLFEQVGSLIPSSQLSNVYLKISSGNGGLNPENDSGSPRSHKNRNIGKNTLTIVFIIVASFLVIASLLYVVLCYGCRKKRFMNFSQNKLEEDDDDFLNNFSGMPVRFNYNDLCRATKSFSTKIGQGGFGSVYQGELQDGTQLAVKRLEAIGQGKKQFRAEVSTIGKVHHLHLVKLRGFCTEGTHRLLVYEYMENGSLNKWIFKTNEGNQLLSWNIRFNIALGTAKGLAYLHSECDVKIIHCDIKPENILLDENFTAKVADFGLAKLMTHEESRAYTTLRGTRGYLAPEWIKNKPISEKSDVYGYEMVLLEIIGGRRSCDPEDDSEKGHLPSYAFRMLEEGKLNEIIDPKLEISENDERVVSAIKVALWCIQEDMHLRPPMTKVVQMLEGSCAVPPPPTPSQLSSQEFPGFNWSSEGDISISPHDSNNGGLLSDVILSAPRW